MPTCIAWLQIVYYPKRIHLNWTVTCANIWTLWLEKSSGYKKKEFVIIVCKIWGIPQGYKIVTWFDDWWIKFKMCKIVSISNRDTIFMSYSVLKLRLKRQVIVKIWNWNKLNLKELCRYLYYNELGLLNSCHLIFVVLIKYIMSIHFIYKTSSVKL